MLTSNKKFSHSFSLWWSTWRQVTDLCPYISGLGSCEFYLKFSPHDIRSINFWWFSSWFKPGAWMYLWMPTDFVLPLSILDLKLHNYSLANRSCLPECHPLLMRWCIIDVCLSWNINVTLHQDSPLIRCRHFLTFMCSFLQVKSFSCITKQKEKTECISRAVFGGFHSTRQHTRSFQW